LFENFINLDEQLKGWAYLKKDVKDFKIEERLRSYIENKLKKISFKEIMQVPFKIRFLFILGLVFLNIWFLFFPPFKLPIVYAKFGYRDTFLFVGDTFIIRDFRHFELKYKQKRWITKKGVFFYSEKPCTLFFRINHKNLLGEWHKATWIDYPKIESLKVYVKYPSEMELPVDSLVFPEFLTLPEGTRIKFKILFKNADSFKIFYGKESVDIKKWFLINKSNVFNLVYYVKGFSDTIYKISVDIVKDEKPEVEILYPFDPYLIPKDMKIKVIFKAEDDYGVKSSWVLWEHYLKGRKKIKVNKYENLKELIDSCTLDFSWLLPGDSVFLWVEVADAKHIAKSQKIKVYFPTLSQLYSYTKAAFDTFSIPYIKSFLKEQKSISEKLKSIEEEIKYSKNLSPVYKEKLLKLVREQRVILEKFGLKLSEFDKRIKNLLETYSEDEEFIQSLRRLSELYNELLESRMQELLDKFENFLDTSNLKQIEEYLKETEIEQSKMIERLKNLVELLERYKQELDLKRFAQISKQISEKQLKIKGKKEYQKDITEEIKNLRKELNEFEKGIKEDEKWLKSDLEQIEKKLLQLEELSEGIQNMPEGFEEYQQRISEEMQQISKEFLNIYKKLVSKRKKKLLEKLNKVISGYFYLFDKLDTLEYQVEICLQYPVTKYKSLKSQISFIEENLNKLLKEMKKISQRTFYPMQEVILYLIIASENIKVLNQDLILEDLDAFKDNLIYEEYVLGMSLKSLLNLIDVVRMGKGGVGVEEYLKQLEKLAQLQEKLSEQIKQSAGLPIPFLLAQKFAMQQRFIKEALSKLIQNLAKRRAGNIESLKSLSEALEEMKKVEEKLKKNEINGEIKKSLEKIKIKLLEGIRGLKKQEISARRYSIPGRNYPPSHPEPISFDKLRMFKFKILKNLSKLQKHSQIPQNFKKTSENYLKKLLKNLYKLY